MYRGVPIAPQGRRISADPDHFFRKKSCKNNQKSLTYFLEYFFLKKIKKLKFSKKSGQLFLV